MILWKVDKLSVEDAIRPQLQDEDKISRSPMLKLSKFFFDLNEERLHVVIQHPPTGACFLLLPTFIYTNCDLTNLNCLVLGYDSRQKGLLHGSGLWRLDGARDGELILAELDRIQMLHAIFHGLPELLAVNDVLTIIVVGP